MWLYLILVVLTQCCTGRHTDAREKYFITKTERGYQSEVVQIACDPGTEVTKHCLSLSKLNNVEFSQVEILSVSVGSQKGCGSQSDRWQRMEQEMRLDRMVEERCRGAKQCSFTISGSLLQSECSGGGDR